MQPGKNQTTVGLQKNDDLKYTTLGQEPVSIVHYTRPRSRKRLLKGAETNCIPSDAGFSMKVH